MLDTFNPFVVSVCLPALPTVTSFFRASSSVMRLKLAADVVNLTTKRLVFNPLDSGYKQHPPLLLTVVLFLLTAIKYVFSRAVSRFIASQFLRNVTKTNNMIVSHSVTASRCSKRRLTNVLTIVNKVGKVTAIVTPVKKNVLTRVAD